MHESKTAGKIHYKTTEQLVGFIVYVAQTYTNLFPYLKGIYLTLNSWRKGRDSEGWLKLEMKRLRRLNRIEPDGKPPVWVEIMPQFYTDIAALMDLTKYKDPPDLPVRASNDRAVYCIGDASGSGFGNMVWIQGGKVVDAEFGNWTFEVSETNSSNFRESANLVIKLKRLILENRIQKGSEVFVVTDNFVAEATFFKGSAKSPLLHELIVKLRKLEMEGQLIITFTWLSGKRMIAQGTDGLSRGDFSSGVMQGKAFLDFFPLNETAFQLHKPLREVVLSWVHPHVGWEVATMEDWFDGVFKQPYGRWIWSPPPCLAKIAVEQLCKVKHIFPDSQHVFVCPSVMTGYWRKKLGKIADSMFTLKAG